jgi:quaternary ammonium compound-resistance protein SugE
MTQAWIALLVAGVLEICWAVGLKYTDGFRRPFASIAVVVALAGSIFLLARAAQQVPLGTAYAVWVGIGALGAAVAGVLLFGEALSPLRLAFLVLLLVSIVGLKLTS